MTPEEQRKLTEEFKMQAEYQRQVSQSFNDYIEGVKEYKRIQATINKNKQVEAQLNRELLEAQRRGDADAIEAAKIKLAILREQTEEIEIQAKALNNALASVNKKSLAGASMMASAAKGLGKAFANLPNLVEKGYGKIKSLGLFELDKEMKKSALSMGVLSKQSGSFRSTIKSAAIETSSIGMGIKEISQMQSAYSEELGRTVVLSKEGMVAMGQMAAATSLGVEGAAQLSAEMEIQGLSAERTGQFVEQTMNDAHKMGVNASKVIKNIQNNIKMLNKYHFKDGVQGLAKMAALVSKLGVSMEFAAGFADKLWDVEGAVDMSAQLQVMGGEWSKMADPFRLMYMARNDMAGLTEEIANAAASSAKFNAKTGEFELGAMEMHRLKIIADQTGMSYDELATAGKNAAKFTKIKGQIGFSMSKEQQEFLSNTSKLDKNGKAYIEVKGEKKYLSQLTSADKKYLDAQIKEKQTMKERAEQATTFDEQLTYLINQLKVYMLPLVETMNEKLIPKLKSLSDKFTKGGWGDKLEKLATTVGELVSSIGGFIIDNPIMSAAVYLGAKLGGILWDKLSWIANGVLLAKGFNSAASVGGMGGSGGGGGIMDFLGGGGGKGKLGFGARMMKGLGNLTGGKNTMMGRGLRNMAASSATGKGIFGKFGSMKGGMSLGKSLGKGAKAFTGLGAVSLAADLGRGMMDDPNSDLGKTIGIAGQAAEWASYGAMLGSVVPGLGTAVGGIIGGVAGGVKGLWDEYFSDEARGVGQKVNDGVFGSPLHDGAIGSTSNIKALKNMGSDFSKGRGLIQNGKVHPIDNKDDLLAMKPGGVVDQAMGNTSNMVTHEFGTLNISGEIILKGPGANAENTVDLLKDAAFKRDITRIIQVELEKNKNGGKNKG